ncbi:MAG: aldehyde dehydrogenase family protein, partial [Leisingera sp.]
FYQVLETSDVPAGVVNILTGSHAELAKPLASHLNLDAVWSFSSTDLSAQIEAASAGNLKRTWVNNATATDWMKDHSKRFLQEATEIKNIWVPYGE